MDQLLWLNHSAQQYIYFLNWGENSRVVRWQIVIHIFFLIKIKNEIFDADCWQIKPFLQEKKNLHTSIIIYFSHEYWILRLKHNTTMCFEHKKWIDVIVNINIILLNYILPFFQARIKKIMQTDEDVGKVAAPVPVIISRALELFVENLLKKANQVTLERGARTLTPSHL